MDAIMFIAVIYLIPAAIDYFRSRAGVISPSLKISYGLVFFCIPVGFSLCACSLIRDVIRIFH